MRKIHVLILSVMVATLCGCSVNSQNVKTVDPKTHLGPENTYTLALDAESMIIPQFTYTESSIDLSSYNNILENATEIVYGEVESVENYNGMGGTAWIKESVRIIESYKGQLQPNVVIDVVQQTGYISGWDFINSFAEEERENVRNSIFENISDEELDNLILDQTNGIPLDEAGDKIVFCLWESPQSSDDVVYYEPVGDWAGKQVNIGNGQYAQYYPVLQEEKKTTGENCEVRSMEAMKELLKIE